VGRLDDIIERNLNPRRAMRKRKGPGVGLVSIVLFVVILLLIFTNLAQPPEDAVAPAPPSGSEHRVRDVRLGAPVAAPVAAPKPAH
jgi:hypothetical protein